MFQVNCPGCFLYGFPLLNKLYAQFKDDLGFIGLSTAFEDFDLNTAANTQLLIDQGELVGATKQALSQNGVTSLPYSINFPVGMDQKVMETEHTAISEKICHLNPNFTTWSPFDQNLLRNRVLKYLQKQQQISYTFTANQFNGTPTIVLFNNEMDLLHAWFGHVQEQEIVDKIVDLQNLSLKFC